MNEFIKTLMVEHGLNQKELAEIIGIAPAAVSQWSDVKKISIDNLMAISRLFQVTVDELLSEKRISESIEEKCKRIYNVNPKAAMRAMINLDEDTLIGCVKALIPADRRFFELLYKKICKNISGTEESEWCYLRQFYEDDIKIYRSRYFQDCIFIGKNIEEKISEVLNEQIGLENKDEIIWELQKIYHITDYGIDQSIFDDFSDQLYYAVYEVKPQIEKDRILTKEYIEEKRAGSFDIEYLNELMNRGGRLLYTTSDLMLENYDVEQLNQLEGEKIEIKEMNSAYEVEYCDSINYDVMTYENYQKIINKIKMNRFQNEYKYKKTNPIKYWEIVKKEIV